MTERQFAPGEVIYREGDKSDFAYFIKSGRVEILKNEIDGPRQATVLGVGDVFGEMGVVLDQRRSVSARALDQVVVRAVSRSSFLHAVNEQPDAARQVLKTLLARLHEGEERAAEPRALPPAPAAALQTPRLRLVPASERLGKLMRGEGLEVSRLPFRVGRKPAKGEKAAAGESDLALEDSRPFTLARRHFAIEQSRRGLIVRDCGSQHGTVVNGVRIGKGAGIDIAILRTGDNEIIAGAEVSPYRFRLEVAGA